MKLADYISSHEITASSLAVRLGVNVSTVSRIIAGKRMPSAELMRRIVEATDGAVTPNDFYDLPSEAPPGERRSGPGEKRGAGASQADASEAAA